MMLSFGICLIRHIVVIVQRIVGVLAILLCVWSDQNKQIPNIFVILIEIFMGI